jgi:hypothetical protein
MVARVLELVPRAGNSKLLGCVIEDKVRSLLMTVPGFMEQAILVSEGESSLGESSLVVLLSMWKSQRVAERYDRKLLPLICDMTQPLREAFPQEKLSRATSA